MMINLRVEREANPLLIVYNPIKPRMKYHLRKRKNSRMEVKQLQNVK